MNENIIKLRLPRFKLLPAHVYLLLLLLLLTPITQSLIGVTPPSRYKLSFPGSEESGTLIYPTSRALVPLGEFKFKLLLNFKLVELSGRSKNCTQ